MKNPFDSIKEPTPTLKNRPRRIMDKKEQIQKLFNALEHGDDAHRAWLFEAITAHFEGKDIPPVRGNKQRYKLVSDQSCHDYVIPVEKSKEWYDFLELPEDDPKSWDVPEWAKMIGGGLTFTDPQTS